MVPLILLMMWMTESKEPLVKEAWGWYTPATCGQVVSSTVHAVSIWRLELSRLFDLEPDHFTIVTEDVSRYRYAHGYAGIPKSCESCSKDILEHQVLHLVWHDLCRFCRYEMRPVSRNVITVRDYEKEADALVKRNDRTCSVCLDMSFDKLSREKHESVVHFKETQKFKCGNYEKNIY